MRLALGAPSGRLVGLFVWSGLTPVVAGAFVGSIGIWLAAPYVKALLFRVPAHDPLSIATGLGVVLAASGDGRLRPRATARSSRSNPDAQRVLVASPCFKSVIALSRRPDDHVALTR